ncbi:ATP-binding cassette domain-containing protein [Anaerocolumna jejuensis]|uniref:ATP-binding cassette domain-containing protein n=1 Tax=Anaerocolumna jejuensis TaxID=259063 RepID=UPI003F7BF356
MKNTILSYQNVSLVINNNPVLKNINLTMQEGEFRILLGSNGSGKSSLTRILGGIYPYGQYSGNVYFDNQLLHLSSPKDAILKGIILLQQDTYLYDQLSVAENLYCLFPGNKSGLSQMSPSQKIAMTEALFKEWDITLNPKKPISRLNAGQKRIIELLRLMLIDNAPKLLILDEPLNNLSDSFLKMFYRIIEHFINAGTAILYITHRLEEVMQYGSSISIVKDGELVTTFENPSTETKDVYKLLWSNLTSNRYPKLTLKRGNEVFCAEHLGNGDTLRDISFTLYKREIIGITGVIGAGKSILAKTLFGLCPATEGKFYVDCLEAKIQSPQDAINLGIAYITDERIDAGLFMNQTSLENAFSLGSFSSRGLIRETPFEHKQFAKYSKRLNLFIDSQSNPEFLSGGEQQKLLLMRWFMTASKIFIFDEPTSRLDIASKTDIYNLFNDLLLKDAAIIVCSSDLEELTGICDRILVLNNGRITYEAERADKTSFSELYQHIGLE